MNTLICCRATLGQWDVSWNWWNLPKRKQTLFKLSSYQCWLLLRYISWLVKVILSTMHFKMQLWHHTNIMMCDLIFGEWSGEILISNCSLHWMGIPYMFTALVHLQWFNSFSVQHLKILGYLFLNLHDIMRKGSPSGIFLSRRRLSIWSKKWNPMCHNIVIDRFLAFSYIYM